MCLMCPQLRSITAPSHSTRYSAEVCAPPSPFLPRTLMRPFSAAEDVLGDLGVRQAIRAMPKNARL